jgi:hypothetical protein
MWDGRGSGAGGTWDGRAGRRGWDARAGMRRWDVRGLRAGSSGMYVGHAPGGGMYSRRDACRRDVRGARAGMRQWDVRGVRAPGCVVGCTWGTRRDARSGMYVGYAPGCVRDVRGVRAPGCVQRDVRGVRAPGACRVRASAHRLRSDAPLSGLELPRSLRGVARGPRAWSRPHEHVDAPALTACAPASAQRLHAPPDLRYATASRWLCVGCGLSPCHAVPVGATLRNSMEVFAR